jgi:hypothetical protein
MLYSTWQFVVKKKMQKRLKYLPEILLPLYISYGHEKSERKTADRFPRARLAGTNIDILER